MTTNQELRKLAEEAQEPFRRWLDRSRITGDDEKLDAFFGKGITPAKVIELLDRIDRLEAENEQRVFAYGVLEKVSSDLLAQNEVKDRLLERARDVLQRNNVWDSGVLDDIAKHLKGTP